MAAAFRQTDMLTAHPHCYPPTVAQTGSPDVYTNMLQQMRVGDPGVIHGAHCPPHQPKMVAGSGTVYVNGKPACRVGDAAHCGSKAGAGSGNVFIGG